MFVYEKISTCILKGRLAPAELLLWEKLDYGVNEDRVIVAGTGKVIPIQITRKRTSTEFGLFSEGYQKMSPDEARNSTETHTHPPVISQPILDELMRTWFPPEAIDIFSDADIYGIAKREYIFPDNILLPPGKVQRVLAKNHIYTLNRIGSRWPREFLRVYQEVDDSVAAFREHLLARPDLDRIKMSDNSHEVMFLMETKALWNFITEIANENKIHFYVWEIVD